MRSARILTSCSLGLLACLCGCYHYGYSPYGTPYGAGPYPGNAFPPESYPPPGGSVSPSYVPYGASGASPTPIGPGGGPTPQWNPAPGGSTTPYENGKGLVPKPTPDDEKQFGTPPGEANLTPTGPGNAALSGSGVQLQPIEPGPAFPTGANAASNTLAGDTDPFDVSARSVSSGSTVTERTPSAGSGDSRPNPYAHDAKNFAWLRGIVDYDSQDQRWVMIYSGNPSPADRYGGSITLSEHPLLNRIKPRDVVLVEGAVDNASFDQHGKPLYRIDKLIPLKPKS